jgi:CubicO group peptidase (beta-lactamase class C family)
MNAFLEICWQSLVAVGVACLIGCGTQRSAHKDVETRHYSVPQQVNDGWNTADVRNVGLDNEQIESLLGQIKNGSYKDIHSVLIVKNGKLAVEAYFPGQEEDGRQQEYGRDTLHGIHSATKSVNSILIGIAIAQHRISDVDAKVSNLLPEYSDLFTNREKDEIRLKHLLSMTAGLSWSEWGVSYADARNDHVGMNRSADPVRYVLGKPLVSAPGSKFNYSSGISIVLGEMVYKSSGLRPDKFAEEHLFKPLGISNYQWLKYPNGMVQSGGGLYMRPRDMAKIGYLFLNGGRWQGKQIVSEEWIRESTTQQAPDAQYGYQWWLGRLRAGDQAVLTVGAQGRGGQFILILPELQMVAVFTSWNEGNGLTEQPIDMLQRFVIPAALQSPPNNPR